MLRKVNLASNTRYVEKYTPLFCTLATDDEAALPTADTVGADANETPSLTETAAGSWVLAEVEGTSLEALSAPPVTTETLLLMSGRGLEPVPAKIHWKKFNKKQGCKTNIPINVTARG